MQTLKHNCGGTLIDSVAHINPDGDSIAYVYCATCRAFVYEDDPQADDMPTGTDEAANRQAWDAGETRSPDAYFDIGSPICPTP